MSLIHKGSFNIFVLEGGMVSPGHRTAKWADRVFGTYEASKPLVPEVLDRAIWRMVVQQAQYKDGEQLKLFYSLDTTIEIKLAINITKGDGRPTERESYKETKRKSQDLYGYKPAYSYDEEERIVKHPLNDEMFKRDLVRMINRCKRMDTSNRNMMICAIVEKAIPLMQHYDHYYWMHQELRDWRDADWKAASEDICKLLGTSDARKIRTDFMRKIRANKPTIPQVP